MRFRWKNFRSFEQSDWVDLRRLNVVIGPNNTGKTSLYQPLLLLRQTLESRFDSQALIAKGDLIDAGHFGDIVYRHREDRSIVFQFDDFGPLEPWDETIAKRLQGRQPNGLGLTFASDGSGGARLAQYQVQDEDGRPLLTRSLKASGLYTLTGLGARPLLPRDSANDPATIELLRSMTVALPKDQPVNFLFQGRQAFDLMRTVGHIEDFPAVRDTLNYIIAYGLITSFVYGVVADNLRRISYLGPLRALPERWYELSGEMPASVGKGGRYAPEIVYRLNDGNLSQGVSEWLDWFGFASQLEFRDLESDSFSLRLRRTKASVPINLADCGMGVSQVLPLIVQGLHANSGDLLIVEQPETHLNPTLQAKLADLFVAFAQNGRRLVVETHSEHLLLRLRTLVAKGDLPSEQFGLFFAEKSKDDSAVRRIEVDESGGISPTEWPRDFFEEGLTEALALAKAQSGTS